MANLLLKLGSYTFPDTFYAEQVPTNRNIPQAKLPRSNGARVIAGYLEGKTFRVKGGLVGGHEAIPTSPAGTPQTLRQQLDALRAACNAGMTTFQTHDDRYWRNAQVGSFEEQYGDTAFGHWAEVSFEVIVGDPFAYDQTTQAGGGTLSATGQTKTIAPGGSAYALPQIALTIGSGTSANISVTNQATGEAFTLKGTVAAGDVYVIDSLTETVTKSGLDSIALFDGLFPTLLPNASNILRVDYVGATVTNIAVNWNNRWF